MNRTVIMFLLVVAAGCSPRAESPPAERPETDRRPAVYAVNYPLAYFAERVGGEHIEVVFPAPADIDPAFWRPGVETIGKYQRADLILLNGAGYAKWVEAALLPDSKLIVTSSGFAEEFLRIESSVTHTHGPGGEHAHGDIAFTTWLDPRLAIRQAKAISDALASRWPEHRESFERKLEALEGDLLELDVMLAATTSSRPGTPLVFSHPVYQYLAHRYDLNGRSVHWEPDAAPSAQQWQELEQLRIEHPAAWMVWEGDPLPATVAKLEELGLGSVVFDPCGNRPREGDFLGVMRGNIERLESVFE